MGRLFDAVAALLGVRQAITYEAQAAIELEALSDPGTMGYYPWQLIGEHIEIKPMLISILDDLRQGCKPSIIAGKFHNTIARITLEIALGLQENRGIDRFILSGGVWQNQLLLERTLVLFQKHDLQPLVHRQTPPNDGCVAFGQAMVAAYRYQIQKE
jgi:hydrogenase maturation protein HypF